MKKCGRSFCVLVIVSLVMVLTEIASVVAQESGTRTLSSDPSALNRRIQIIRTRNHIAIPIPEVVEPGFSQTPRIEILNATEAYLTIYFNGPSPRQVHIRPGAIESLALISGDYEVAAQVSDPGVLPFFSIHRYNRELYQIRFSIRSIRSTFQ